MDKDAGTLRLSPRHSFEAWKTLLRHRSRDLEEHQLEAARELRRSAIEIDLTAQVLREQAAVVARNELVAVVSHDLRSPMSVVALQALVLNRALVTETSAAPRRMLEAVQSIQRATGRMTSMLTDLLDTAAIEQGRHNVDMAPVAVEALFEDARASLTPIAESKHVALSFDAGTGLVVNARTGLPGDCQSGRTRIEVHARRRSGPGLRPASPDQDGRLVRFLVADTGCGMGRDELTHIFERYWKARESNRTGSGLGLYIASGIVQAHGGTIWAESTLGLGSVFAFTLTAAEPLPISGLL